MTDAFGSAGRRSLALVLALALLGSVFFGTMPVFATGGSVARIGEATYNTLDDAIAAAEDGDVIELLADATTAGMNLNMDLTIQAAEGLAEKPKLTFDQYGIALGYGGAGRPLLFKDIDIEMKGIVSTAVTGEWNWMAICVGTGASISLDNVNMTMDAAGASGNKAAVYFCGDNTLNLENNSSLCIKNYSSNALSWDGGAPYITNIRNSTFISDNNRSAFTGTFKVNISDSNVQVINSSGNGSNGSHFRIENSAVVFNNNGSHGLSAGSLLIDNSSVTASNNGGNGIHTNSVLTIQNNSHVKIEENDCSISSQWTIPGALHVGSGESTIDETSQVTIQNNSGSGILLKSGSLTVADGASLVVTNNYAEKLGYGGGVNNRGTMVLPNNVELYNNHAENAGDDIFNNTAASITFGKVDSDWVLDDCNHVIDGWYDDSENARWKAHETGSIDDNHIKEFTEFPDGIAEVNELKALKAAHGLILPAWDISKSKTATNLDENLESDVTLALPAAEYRQTMDVVFVIDDTHAGSGIFAKSVSNLLDELASKKNLDISVGVVAFDAVSRDWLSATSGDAWSGLVSIQEEGALEALKKAVETELSYGSDGYQKKVGGTNTEWPVEMASQMLQSGSGEDKYLIMFSDLYGYIYRGDLTIGGVTYHDVPLSKRLGSWDQGSLSMGTKYRTFDDAYAHRNDSENQTVDGFFRDSSWNRYWNVYQGLNSAPANTIADSYQVGPNSYSGFEKSLCLTYDRLTSAAQDARVILVNNNFANVDAPNAQNMIQQMLNALESGNSGVTIYRYPTGSADEALSGDAAGNIFNGIREQLIQLVDDGSYVADEIGSGMYNGAAYDFAFVNDASRLSLTVGGESLTATALSDEDLNGASAAWQFDDEEDPNQFTLYYYEKGTTYEENSYGECLIWEIHVPVTKDAPVQLTYSVRLTNPQTDPKKYGEYDADGSECYPGLYTNNSATLYPKNSYGKSGQPEAFGKPTVSYKAGVSVIDPDPTPGTPLEPVSSTPDSSEPPAPDSSSAPSDPIVSSQPAVSDGASEPSDSASSEAVADPDVPKTGDESALILWLTLAGAALLGLGGTLLIARRKENEDLSD